MEDELRMNREADYAGAAVAGQHMKLGFFKHALMISRLHFMLEMASRRSDGEVAMAQWRQGVELRGHKLKCRNSSRAVLKGATNTVGRNTTAERSDCQSSPMRPGTGSRS